MPEEPIPRTVIDRMLGRRGEDQPGVPGEEESTQTPAWEPPPAPIVPLQPRQERREWNLWELEQLARTTGGGDPARDEEWSFMLVYLREFERPGGSLPADFDQLVRESFPELVAVLEPLLA